MTSRNELHRRVKGRQTTKSFVMFPHDVMDHEKFRTLSPRASKLLLDIASQFRGNNNGDLCAPFKQMKKRGWRSSDQLNKAKKELVEKGFLLVSRQGGLNKPTLYAITWFAIHECSGKLDIKATTTPPRNWRLSQSVSRTTECKTGPLAEPMNPTNIYDLGRADPP
jgi:hypothetical protein